MGANSLTGHTYIRTLNEALEMALLSSNDAAALPCISSWKGGIDGLEVAAAVLREAAQGVLAAR